MFQPKVRIFMWRQNDGCSISTAGYLSAFPLTTLHFDDPSVFRNKSKHHCSCLGVQLPWWAWELTLPCTLLDVIHPRVSAHEGEEQHEAFQLLLLWDFLTGFQISNGLTFGQLIHPFMKNFLWSVPWLPFFFVDFFNEKKNTKQNLYFNQNIPH